MNPQRFEVRSITGYAIGRHGGTRTLSTSYWIIDHALNCREVGRYFSRTGVSAYVLRARADKRAAELNAWAEAVAA